MTRLNRYAEPVLRAMFPLALAGVLAVALYPLPGESTGNADKISHFAAFYALTLLGAAAYSRPRDLTWLVLVLSAYGALIEVLQPLPPFGRDRDLMDWVADNAGIAFAVMPILLVHWRRRLGSQPQ